MSEQSPEKHLLENGFRSLARVGETTLVLISAGIRYAQDKSSAPTLLRETFEKLGATYIKLGQFIASSPSLFPRAYVQEFQRCLDQTTPIPFAQIQAKLMSEFDRPLTEIFSHIEQKCLASASIAQVHAATLVTGEDVVIKVQKPGVGTILHTDLNVVHFVAKLLERVMPKLKFASLAAMVNEIKIRMVREVDFVEESNNISDFKAFLDETQNTQVVAPKVYTQASTRTVLTMERLYGVPMVDIEIMKQYTKEPSQALITAMNTWFSSLMLCKSFHADLHAGNLMLLTDGRVGFIDFGIVGQLKPEVWQSSISFMQALQVTDYAMMAENMVKMGMTNAVVDVNVLQKDIETLFSSLLMSDPQKIIMDDKGDLNMFMMDIVQVGERHGIKFPSDFALLIKQMLYFDRFMQVLTPNMDMFADSRLQFVVEEPVSKLIH
jgi:predicted unusual protein kinase regulating ubiquinone biosynthesis (AarF/ABC1/UbiB family)